MQRWHVTGEKHDASGVETEQFDLVSFPARQLAVHARLQSARHGLRHVAQHGQSDEEAGDVVEHQRRSAGLRVLKRTPHVLARRRRQVLIHLRTP